MSNMYCLPLSLGRFDLYLILALLVCGMVCVNGAAAQEVVRFDLRQSQYAQQWQPTHDIAGLSQTAEGLQIRIGGEDPYLFGPVFDYPQNQPLWFSIRLYSDQGGVGQLFYFPAGTSPTEPASVRFPVPAKRWVTLRMPVPPFGLNYQIRFDPPGDHGTCTVAWMAFEKRDILRPPKWPHPTAPVLSPKALLLRSGSLELLHNPDKMGDFVVRFKGTTMAAGDNKALIGYIENGKTRFIPLQGKTSVQKEGDGLKVQTTLQDPDGAIWTLSQRFSAPAPNLIQVDVEVRVNLPRNVVFLPVFLLFPGLGSFGEHKTQALFPGLEYLGPDEPSSSQADIRGPQANRQVPDTEKITFPLMVVAAQNHWIALSWQMAPNVCALFDTPDRQFHSGAQVMGVLFPGSNGLNREEGSLLPYDGNVISPEKPFHSTAYILCGDGQTVVPAIQRYVSLWGLPHLPDAHLDWQGCLHLAASGWLHSGIVEGDRLRHAYPNFGPQPVADAPTMMLYAAAQGADTALAQELEEGAQRYLSAVPPQDFNSAGIGHVRFPVPSLVFGHVIENADTAAATARSTLSQFTPEGTILYNPPPHGEDLASTNPTRTANGLTASVVVNLLYNAIASGDPTLIALALQHLRALERFDNTVPRGAQSWEVPLHTPDILASAHLVRAFVLGYMLSGDKAFLERAKAWAWTGLPFVYLYNPTGHAVGPYATPPVFGATHWVAPNWMGLPVQWCGLVYASALYQLAPFDPKGPWRQIADGITISGIQQTWPIGSDPLRQGLLPDSFNLKGQIRNDPAINPCTLFAELPFLFRKTPLYSFHAFLKPHLLLQAPGEIKVLRETSSSVTCEVNGWPIKRYYVLMSGFQTKPEVLVNGKPAPTDALTFDQPTGRLVVALEEKSTLTIKVRSQSAER
ncbi:hypothetical protein [Chthonomonas calidirosea]|uniref:hypothetical protein n=1 Tax=Chthonomonas calidirosea TaxID=454171 RepID=UPI0006EC64E2|nr:hypothetical protein [Chthonomonas calidirosea]CEK17794.1 hypothetical protein CP488_01968 [Chthonomonas calidirosea]